MRFPSPLSLERPHYRAPLRAIWMACIVGVLAAGIAEVCVRARGWDVDHHAKSAHAACAQGQTLSWSGTAWVCLPLEPSAGTSLSWSGTTDLSLQTTRSPEQGTPTLTSTGVVELNLTPVACKPGEAVVAVDHLGHATCAWVHP